MSKQAKFFVFQESKSGIQVEVGRKARGAGRPPVGPNIVKDEDGNVYISNVLTTKPQNVAEGVEYIKVDCDNGTIVWYEKSKPASRTSPHKYVLVNGKLVDEGIAGRGRPGVGYVKVTEDKVVDGINLNCHLFNDGSVVSEPKKVKAKKAQPVAGDEDLEAQAAADAMRDIAAEGEQYEEFEEVDVEEEETV